MRATGDEFFRKPLASSSAPILKVKKEHDKETLTEMNAAISGLTKDQMKWRDRLYRLPYVLIFAVLLYFVGKNQIYPYVSRRFNKVILE